MAFRTQLDAALEQRGYSLDVSQQAAVDRLQRLYEDWAAYKAHRSNALKKLLVRPPVPRGVYLGGDVGRGKSFLMDAFFATVPLIRKTRVHFHEFMRGVHAELHELKGIEDPLDEVARRIAKRHRLICFDEFHVSDIADAMILYRLLERLFAVNFWAWSLLSPLAPRYQELLGLSPLAVSVMVAVPVIVGSLGRIPLGALTDRYGGRIVVAVLSFVVIAPVLFLAFATSYPALLLGGLVLGLGGASFAVGVPFVSAWFPPERRGVALGIYGMGNIGTAISGFVSPRVANSLGRPWAFLIVAVALAAVGLAFLVLGRDAPNRPQATQPFMTRFLEIGRASCRERVL